MHGEKNSGEVQEQRVSFVDKFRECITGELERYSLEDEIREKLKKNIEEGEFTRKELAYIMANVLKIKKVVQNQTSSGIYFLLYRGTGSVAKLSRKMGIYRNGIYYWIKRFQSINLIREYDSPWDRREKIYRINKPDYPSLTNEIFQMIIKHHGRNKITKITGVNQDPVKSVNWS